jgi:hypothetical protein
MGGPICSVSNEDLPGCMSREVERKTVMAKGTKHIEWPHFITIHFCEMGSSPFQGLKPQLLNYLLGGPIS